MKKIRLSFVLAVLFAVSIACSIYIVLNNRLEQSAGKTILFSIIKKTAEISSDAVAIIPITGPIFAGQSSSFMQGSSNPGSIIRKLKRFGKRKDIKAVVLRINSPGGSVASVQEIYREIIHLRKSGMPVIASFGDVAASGGYYVAAACDRIVANPGTITGSIGVIMELGNFRELFKKIGVKLEVIKSGRHKDAGSPHRELTPEERRIFQGVIDDAYGQFVRAVADGRKMDIKAVRKLATGRIFTGSQAKKKGLVDHIGGLQDAVRIAAEIAGIKGEPRVIDETDPITRFLAILESRLPRFSIPYATLAGRTAIQLNYLME